MDQQFCQSATAVVVNKNSSVHSSSSPSHSSSSAQEANHDSELTLDRQCSTLNYQIMKASELASSGNVSVFYKQRSPGGLQPEFVPILPNKSATTTSNSSVEDQTSHQKVAQQMVVDSKPVATPQVTYTNRQAVSHAQNNQLISSPNSATGGKNHTDITEESSLQARLEQKKALTVTPVNKPVLPKPPVQTNQRPKLVRSPVQAKSPQSLNQKSIQPQQVKPSPTQPQVNILHQGKPIIIQQQQVKSPVQGKAQLVQQAKSISSPRPNVTPIQVVKTVPQLPKPQVTPIQGKKLVTVNLKSNQIQLKQQLPQQIAQQGKVIQNKPPQPVQNKPPQPVQNKPSSSPVKQVSVQQAKQLNQFRVQSSQAAKQSFIQVNSQLKTYQPPTSPQLPKSVQLTVANSPAVNVSQQPSLPAVSVSQQAARNNVQTAASTFNITSKRANSSPANSGSPAKRTSLLQDMTPLMPLAERCRKSYQSTKKKTKVLTDADIDKFKLPSQVAAQVVQQAKQLSQQSTQLIQQSNQQMNQSNQLNQQPNQQTKQVFQLKQAGANPLPPVSATVLPSGLSQAITLITNQNKIATVSASNCSDSPQTTSGEKPINIPFQTLPETNQTYRIIIMTNDNKYDFVIDQSGSQIAEALQKLAQPNAGVSEQFGRAITESILRQCANTQSVEDMDGNVSLAAGQPLQLTEKEEESGEASSQESAPSPSKSDCENYEDKMALCHHCGYCSPTHDYCARCKTKLPPDVKSICLKPKTELQSNVLVKRTNEVAVALADSPKKRQRACKKKKVEEPVCLTISSDDEDANDSKCNNFKVAGTSGAGAGAADDPSAAINQDPAITQSVMLKEPVITDEEGAEEGAVKDGDYQDALEDGEIDAMSGECDLNSSETDSEWPVALDCRTVRIGSYKVVPNDRVYITLRGIYITIPSFVCENVKLSIPWESIVKILAHFGKGMPVIFIYTSSPMGAKIRKMLRMTDKNNIPYYDPASANESQRRITLLPENISVECSSLLKNLFSNLERTEYEELSQTEANDILVRASPKEVQNQVQKGVVNTTPRLPNEIQTIMVYPPPPAKGGIPINTEDYACLGEDQFLNDVIIDFYLKYLLQHYLSEKDQSRTHILSTFFYKRLTTKPTTSRRSLHNPVENDPKATAAEKRHSRVKSWTKHVDIFKKDFIIIPINEHSHWYLAVICFPGLTGPVDFDTMQPIDVNGANGAKVADGAKVGTTTAKKKSDTSGAGGDDMMGGKTSLVIGSTTITALGGADTVTVVQSEEEDRDEADGDDEDFDQASSEEEASPLQQDTDSSATKNEMDDNKEPEESAEEPVQESPEAVKVEEKLGRSRRKEPRKPIKQPCILIFDSLATASRAKVVATLRDYLKVEYKVKHGVERQFTKEYMKGASPKVPQQTNYTDCGLYVLQYVEAFFEAPITDYHIPIKTLQEWFDVDIVSRKRYDIQQLLHKLMGEQGIDFSTFNLPDLNLAPFHHGLVDYPDSEDELMAEEEDEEEEGEEEEEEYQEYGEAYRAMCEDARYNGYREEVEEEEEEEDEEGEQHRMHVDEEMECDGDELEDEEEEEEEELEEDEEQDLEEDLERVMMGGEMDKDLLDEMVPNVCELKSYRIPRLNPRNDDIKINQSISIVRTGSIPDNKSDRNN